MVDSQVRNTAALAPSTRDAVRTITVDDAQHATILAALRYYQMQGMGEPDNRPLEIHDIATNNNQVMSSLDAEGIDALCEQINVRAEDAKPLFVVLQEGGATGEIYVHAHTFAEEAEADRISCRDDGSYRTSPVIEVPAPLAAHGELLFGLLDRVARAELSYPDGESVDSDED